MEIITDFSLHGFNAELEMNFQAAASLPLLLPLQLLFVFLILLHALRKKWTFRQNMFWKFIQYLYKSICKLGR